MGTRAVNPLERFDLELVEFWVSKKWKRLSIQIRDLIKKTMLLMMNKSIATLLVMKKSITVSTLNSGQAVLVSY